MHRTNLYNLSPTDRRVLVELILEYSTPSVVNEHWDAVLAGAHNDPAGFLRFHRTYLEGLERYLEEQGFPQWSPLPKWNPAEPIPEEFAIPATGPNRLRNLNPQVSFFPQFDTPNLVNYFTEANLGAALMPIHNRVHTRVGGIMNNIRRAPEVPIFWPFHAFIDDIWWEWQRI